MSYLQSELTEQVKALRGGKQAASHELVATIRDEIRLVESLTGCRWELVTTKHEKVVLSIRQRDALRSFVSEALMNTWKHAGVASGSVELERAGPEVVVAIRDRGRGFDPAASGAPDSLGLKSLHFRAQELGGQLQIESRPGQGCRLLLRFPK